MKFGMAPPATKFDGKEPQVVAQVPVAVVGYIPDNVKNDSEVQSIAFPIWPAVPV